VPPMDVRTIALLTEQAQAVSQLQAVWEGLAARCAKIDTINAALRAAGSPPDPKIEQLLGRIREVGLLLGA